MIQLLEISCSEALLLILIALIIFQTNKHIIRPYLRLSQMKKSLEGKHSYYAYPFTPFGISVIKLMINDFKQYGDSFYTRKKEFSKKQASVGVYGESLLIGLNSKQLVQEYAERQKEGCYQKTGRINYQSFKQLLGDGLLMSQGQEWKYKRKLMSSLFNYQFIKSKFGMIVSIAKEICDEAKKSEQVEGKKLLDINRLFQKIFGTVVIRCFFGDISLGHIQGNNPFFFLSQLIEKVAQRNFRISSFLFGGTLAKFGIRKIDRQIREDIKIFRNYTKDIIEEIIKFVEKNPTEAESEGLIAKLLRQRRLVNQCSSEEKIKHGYYTYDDLTNELCTFFFAGTDTTSNTMASLIYKLIQHKQVDQKLRTQIREVLKDSLDNISLENLKKMDYLRYVQSQILRILSSVPTILPRVALCDHKIGNIFIQKGTMVIVDFLSHQYDETVFENPFQFKPERWQKLEKSPNISQDFYPFSVGLRTCIGQQLALIESKVALIVFLLTFKNGSQVEPPRFKISFTYGPERSLVKYETI